MQELVLGRRQVVGIESVSEWPTGRRGVGPVRQPCFQFRTWHDRELLVEQIQNRLACMRGIFSGGHRYVSAEILA